MPYRLHTGHVRRQCRAALLMMAVNNMPRLLMMVTAVVCYCYTGCCHSFVLKSQPLTLSLSNSKFIRSKSTTKCGNSFRGRMCRKAVNRDSDDVAVVESRQNPTTVVFADYLATCVPGMAQILADEVTRLGGQQVELSGTSAVYFRVPYQNPKIILYILLWCRTAHKIMELLCRTVEPVFTRDDTYEWIRNTIPTTDLLLDPNPDPNSGKQRWFTLSVSVTLNNPMYIPSDINHSHYTALNIKNALVDAAREVSALQQQQQSQSIGFESDRPSVDTTENCDVPLIVMIRGIPSASSSTFTTSYNNNNHDRSRHNNYNTRNEPPSDQQKQSSGGAHISLFRCIHGIGSLHRRGYRNNIQIHKAAMKESTAAALLYASQWHIKCRESTNGAILMDPMMGSGTLLIEGAMIAADIAPGLMRIKCGIPSSQSPPIIRWKIDDDDDDDDDDTDAESVGPTDSIQTIWNHLLIDATKRAQRGIESLQQERRIQIIGNDINDSAYALADMAFQQAGLRNVVQLSNTDCAQWKPKISTANNNDNDHIPWMIVSNPPWGVRLSEDMDISWEALRTFLRSDTSIVPKPLTDDEKSQTEVWILSGNAELTKHLGLRRSQSIPLQTGEQNLRWLQYILRPPGSMTTNYTTEHDSEPKFERSIKRNDNKFDTNGARHRGDTGNAPIQNQIIYRSNNRVTDRDYTPNRRSSIRSSIPNGRQQRQESFSSQSDRGRRQPSKPRKEKTPAATKTTENEWLIE